MKFCELDESRRACSDDCDMNAAEGEGSGQTEYVGASASCGLYGGMDPRYEVNVEDPSLLSWIKLS